MRLTGLLRDIVNRNRFESDLDAEIHTYLDRLTGESAMPGWDTTKPATPSNKSKNKSEK
jgi:hypothetical protein